MISRYFGERISEILNYIFSPEITELLKDNYQIISTGHSLGGAIAQVFIYFALVEGKINKNNTPMTITFNQPKVGNKLFAEFLDENSINLRITRKGDIVSKVPFANFGFSDIINYIIKKRNIHNEYVHTYNEFKNSYHLYINLILKIFISIGLIPSPFFFYFMHKLIEEVIDHFKINYYYFFTQYIISISIIFRLILILVVIALIIFNFIFFISFWKYKSYLFLFLFILFVIMEIIILNLLGMIVYLFILFIIEVIILCVNKCKCDDNKKSKKKSNKGEEKCCIIEVFPALTCSTLCPCFIKEEINNKKFNHSLETHKIRTGNEIFTLNQRVLDNKESERKKMKMISMI